MRALVGSLLFVAACGFNPSGQGTGDDGGAEDGASEDAAAPDGAPPPIDAAPTPIDAAMPIDAATPIDAPAPDPFCTDTGLQACFRMNHGSGAPVDGHSPPLGSVRADGANYLPGCANRGTALDLGAGVFVRTAEPANYTGEFTVSAWVKLDGPLPPVGSERRFWFDAQDEWGLSYTPQAGGSVSVQCLVVLDNDDVDTATATLVNATSWHHVACSFDADHLRLFLDGVKVDDTNTANEPLLNVTTNGVQVGRDGIDQAGGFVDGLIDDVRLWNRRVPDGEIAAAAATGCL